MGEITSRVKQHKWAMIAIFVFLPLIILALGAVLFPKEVWDDFIYRYFWGPVVSDAQGHRVDGIAEGYNVYNTIVYAILLGAALLGMYKIADILELRIDLTFILCSVPLFMFGGAARSLEDAALFIGVVRYPFIAPFIYPMVAFLFGLGVAEGLLARTYGAVGKRSNVAFAILVVMILGAYYAVTMLDAAGFALALDPIIPAIIAAVSVIIYIAARRIGVGLVPAAVLGVGTLALGIASAYLVLFAFEPQWQAQFILVNGREVQPHLDTLFIVPFLAGVITLAIYVVGRVLKMRPLTAGVNMLMLFAQLVDGVATFWGIQMNGYAEKHVLPTTLIGASGSAFIMIPLKILLVLLAILLLDVLFKEELAERPNLAMVMKFAIVFLGLAPGTRDVIRISLGV